MSAERTISIVLVIERLTGVRHHPGWVWALPRHRLGCSVQRPRRRSPTGSGALATDSANAQRRSACLVVFDESALSLTPNVAGPGRRAAQPPTLTHPFNWKKASMAAALGYGVRGGGAQLAFHGTAGNYDSDTLIQVPGRAAPLPGRREGHPVGGWAARLCAGAQPDRGPVVQPQGRGVGQGCCADAGRGSPAGASRHRAGAPDAATGLLVPRA